MATVADASPRASLLTIEGVAEYLGVSKRWVYEETRQGRLPSLYIARSYRFRQGDVDAFVETFRVSKGH